MATNYIQYNKCQGLVTGKVLSTVGPDFDIIGGTPTFVPAKFDNGVNLDAINEYIRFATPNDTFDFAQGTFQAWIKLNGWSVTNGASSGPGLHAIFSFRLSITKRFDLYFGIGGFTWELRDNGVGFNWTSTAAAFDISADTLTNIAFTWDRTHGTKKLIIYINGIEVDSDNTTFSDVVMTGATVTLGTFIAGTSPFDGVYDDFQWFPYAKTDFSDINFEGGQTDQPDYKTNIKTRRFKPKREKIIIAGIDIMEEEKALTMPDFKYMRSYDKDRVINDTITIPVNNDDKFLSYDHPDSPFSNINWYGEPAQLFDRDNIKIWEGIVVDLPNNDEDASGSVVLKTTMFQHRNTKVEYASGGWEDAATAFENIATAYSITNINKKSLELSKGYLQANNCNIKVNIITTDRMNVQATFELIAKYASADFYEYRGELFFQVWQPNDNLAIDINILESELLTPLKITRPDKYLVNNYKIQYFGGSYAEDDALGNIGSLSRTRFNPHDLKDVTGEQKISFENEASAQFIGEQYINRTHYGLANKGPKPLKMIKTKLSMEFRSLIDLSSFFNLTYAKMDWTSKPFEIFEIGFKFSSDELDIVAFENAS